MTDIVTAEPPLSGRPDWLEDITGAEEAVATLFHPRSIAIVGASARADTLSSWPMRLTRQYGFVGDVYPVNPSQTEIDGITCYPSVNAITGPVDVAMIPLNSDAAVQAVRDCADAGVKVGVLPAQGLGERGPEGLAQQTEMVRYANERGMRLVGPNADGSGNLESGAMTTIQVLFADGIKQGPVGLVTQSGATAGSLLRRLDREGIGCRFYVSSGNEADLTYEDYLSYVVQHPDIKVVLSFVESIRRPDLFVKVSRRAAELGKLICLIKVGRSAVGARRALAHTGALAGEDRVYDAVFDSLGVARVGELSELVGVAKLHLSAGSPTADGVGIMSVSGGQAGAIADALAAAGVQVPALTDGIEAELDAILDFGHGFNPCDLTGAVATDPTLAARAFEIMTRDRGVGTMIYARKQLTGDVGVRAAEELARQASNRPAARLVIYAMDGEVTGAEREVWDANGIAVFDSVHELARALAVSSRKGPLSAAAGPVEAIGPRVPLGRGVHDEIASKEALRQYGLPVTRDILTTTPEAAAAAAAEFAGPIVMKVVSKKIAHKSDIGGVAVGVTEDEVRKTFELLRANALSVVGPSELEGISVQPMAPTGREFIVGGIVDRGFGPMVVVGIGGTMAEVLDDVVVLPAPCPPEQVAKALARLRTASVLNGGRGEAPRDIEALVDVVVRASRFLAVHADTIAELDLNPVLVHERGRGATVVDALIVTRDDDTP